MVMMCEREVLRQCVIATLCKVFES
jgi:hypothetical protein